MSTLTVTLIQANLQWENKKVNLMAFEDKIRPLKGQTQLILLPEMFSTGFSMKPKELAEEMNGESVTWMKRVAQENQVIVAGSLIIQEGSNYFNRLIWMLPNGQYGTYDKRHLFGYAGEDQQYNAGSKRLIASVNGWRINLQVCYDLRFPVWARQQSQQEGFEYDLLVYVANWPERRRHAWTTLLQARAIENQCYVIGVNRVGEDGNNIYHSGDSMLIDPLGDVLYTKKDEEDVYTALLQSEQLQKVRNSLPFLKDADGFVILTGEE